MQVTPSSRAVEILLVEDNPGDQRLTVEALKDCRMLNRVTIAGDGEEALDVLRRIGRFSEAARPDIILLDWNLPRMNGRELLEVIKKDESLNTIPVVVLTTSQAERDIIAAYELHANCFITKPVDYDQFMSVVHSIESFWLTIVKLPTG